MKYNHENKLKELNTALAASDAFWDRNQQKFDDLMAEFATALTMAGVEDSDLVESIWQESVEEYLLGWDCEDGEVEV